MKKLIVLLVLLCLCVGFVLAGCAPSEDQSHDGVLTVYNCEDYIDEATLEAFEEWYLETYGKSITVNYITYDTNETMLTKIMNNDADVDLICSSEYAIQKLYNNDKILPINKTPGMGTINQEIYNRVETMFGEDFLNYFVPYMYGTLGILYNVDVFEEEGIDIAEEGWSILWNEVGSEALMGKILLKDSIRDTFAAGVLYLKEQNKLPEAYAHMTTEQLINCTEPELVEAVRVALTEQKHTLKGYEVDFGKDDMCKLSAYVDLAWSGDAMYAIEEALYEYEVNLDYYVPEAGANVWFDGWFIPKCTSQSAAANAFIEFMCKPTVSAANMIYVGYTSAVDRDILRADEEVLDLLIEAEYVDPDDMEATLAEYFEWDVRYPDITNPNYGVMTDYGSANADMTIMWEKVKAATAEGSWPLWQISVLCLGVLAVGAGIVALAIAVWKHRTYNRRYM